MVCYFLDKQTKKDEENNKLAVNVAISRSKKHSANIGKMLVILKLEQNANSCLSG